MPPPCRLLYVQSTRVTGTPRKLGQGAIDAVGLFAPASSTTFTTCIHRLCGGIQVPSARMASTRSRSLHSTSSRSTLLSAAEHDLTTSSTTPTTTETDTTPNMAHPSPLAMLPLTTVIRSLMTTTISSSPRLLPPSMAIMSVMAHTTNPLLNPDRNPILKLVLKKTFYAQYCAGEDAAEVQRTVDSLKQIGFSGVILGYAREVVLTPDQLKGLASCTQDGETAQECIQKEINPWAAGTLQTVLLAAPGDYVALKFTGAGRQALYTLSQRLPPSPPLASAIDSVCQLAASRGVRLLFDAEQQAIQAGIDDWTLDYMRRYNRDGSAVIFGTYQAYLKGTPATLSQHLAAAQRENFALGVKLVRGAYLGSDPRHLIHDTKADTDAAYDTITTALLKRTWSGPLIHPEGGTAAPFPKVSMVLASHNRDSVLKARAMLDAGETGTEVAFAQLQGMADEVSCELVCPPEDVDGKAVDAKSLVPDRVKAYKYLVWGSTGECMKYLLRRAHENRDAVQRTRSGRDAMRAELWRRLRGVFGLSA